MLTVGQVRNLIDGAIQNKRPFDPQQPFDKFLEETYGIAYERDRKKADADCDGVH